MILALHASYFDDNFGDLLLLGLFRKWLTRSGVQFVFPGVPSSCVSFHRHFPQDRTGWRDFSKWDALLYCGGGFFGEPENSAGWHRGFLKRHLLPGLAAAALGKRCAVLAMEVGPLSGFLTRQIVRRMLLSADTVSVRNEESRAYSVSELGIKREILTAPDPGLTLCEADIPSAAREKAEEWLRDAGAAPLFGIHHPAEFLERSREAEMLRAALIRALLKFPETAPIVFSDQTLDDNRAGSELAAFIGEKTGRAALAVPFGGVWETAALISRMNAVATPKLHVAIVASALGKHAESFARHQKTPRFFRQIGKEEHCSMLRSLSPEECGKKMLRAVEKALTRPAPLSPEIEKARDAAFLHQKAAQDFLHSIR